jgi:hypothetical protein
LLALGCQRCRYSVLDKIVPGYYQRRFEDGEMCHSTCCNNVCVLCVIVRVYVHAWMQGWWHVWTDAQCKLSCQVLSGLKSPKCLTFKILNISPISPNGR